MIFYPEDLPQKIYFDFIKSQLSMYCETLYGRDFIDLLSPTNDHKKIINEYEALKSLKKYFQQNNIFSTKINGDIRSELEKLATEGFVINQEMLNSLLQLLTIYINLNKIINDKKLSILRSQHVKFNEADQILEQLKHIWSYEGYIRDDASEELASIRRRIDSMQRNIDKQIKEIWKQWQKKGFVADDSNVTLRDQRLVIPINPEAKDSVKGVIYDESATGQTIYIEPQEIFELNTSLQHLYFDEKKEIYHILRQFTDQLMPYIKTLLLIIDEITYLDVLKAKYLWSTDNNAIIPEITDEPEINLINAYHPYLNHVLTTHNKKIVPLTINLTQNNRFLIISGPNAGGKSVVLLTVATMQWMVQCAIPITAHEGSRLYIFSHIFMDMGDNQSLENEISTYASHLLNMKYILENSNDKSLILMDEMGTGTEPIMGGTIAELVLERLYQNNCFAIVTTHFHNLKLLPMRYPAMQNAALLFDTDTMSPTYILSQGIPGNSFTLEIAQKVGFPQDIINKAQNQLGDNRIETEKLLVFLENERKKLEEQKKQLELAENFVAELIKKYQDNLEFQKKKQNYFIKKTKGEIDEIFSKSNKLIENTIREIKESNAEKNKVKDIRKKLEKEKNTIDKKLEKMLVADTIKEEEKIEFEVGHLVKIKLTGEVGEIIRISENQLNVVVNNKIIQLPISAVDYIDKNEQYINKKIKVNLVSRTESFNTVLDIRGCRADEAINKLDKYIDQALLIGVPRVYIIHGKGYGILRKAVRDYLKDLTHLLNFENEVEERGGDGITVVNFTNQK